jgi:hypothetical protein
MQAENFSLSSHVDLLDHNPFMNPLVIRQMFLDHVIVKPIWQFNGKAFVCVLLNTDCPVGCKHCMFATIPDQEEDTLQHLNQSEISKLLKFVKDANTGYLLVSSAGEPFSDLEKIYEIARETSADITWLVTSGFWAQKKDQAAIVIDNLFQAFNSRQNEHMHRKLFLRISLDSYHVEKLSKSVDQPLRYLINIISLFDQHYSHSSSFLLMLHALDGDDHIVAELVDALGAKLLSYNEINRSEVYFHPAGFHENVKKTERAAAIQLPSGYCIELTYAKLLLSDLSASLNDELFEERIKIFDHAVFTNEKGNPGIKHNPDGSIGPNILINFDGTLSPWQSEIPNTGLNLYQDSYQDMISFIMSDPGVLATLEKGMNYRFDIINEVNPKAVLQSKVINLRDYTSRILFEEDRTKLYYTIRAIQDYIIDQRIGNEQIKNWPPTLRELVSLNNQDLQELYRSSGYDIVAQMMNEQGDGFKALVNLLNSTARDDMQETLKQALARHIIPNGFLLERCYTIFRRISKGWYEISSLSHVVIEESNEIASELGRYIKKTWRGYQRV